jgi:hypothetical protein
MKPRLTMIAISVRLAMSGRNMAEQQRGIQYFTLARMVEDGRAKQP